MFITRISFCAIIWSCDIFFISKDGGYRKEDGKFDIRRCWEMTAHTLQTAMREIQRLLGTFHWIMFTKAYTRVVAIVAGFIGYCRPYHTHGRAKSGEIQNTHSMSYYSVYCQNIIITQRIYSLLEIFLILIRLPSLSMHFFSLKIFTFFLEVRPVLCMSNKEEKKYVFRVHLMPFSHQDLVSAAYFLSFSLLLLLSFLFFRQYLYYVYCACKLVLNFWGLCRLVPHYLLCYTVPVLILQLSTHFQRWLT